MGFYGQTPGIWASTDKPRDFGLGLTHVYCTIRAHCAAGGTCGTEARECPGSVLKTHFRVVLAAGRTATKGGKLRY